MLHYPEQTTCVHRTASVLYLSLCYKTLSHIQAQDKQLLEEKT